MTVDNFANITALAGDGIRAFDYGVGNVTVTDGANTTIQTTGANGQYGIEGYSAGAGDISVTTSAGDTVESAGAVSMQLIRRRRSPSRRTAPLRSSEWNHRVRRDVNTDGSPSGRHRGRLPGRDDLHAERRRVRQRDRYQRCRHHRSRPAMASVPSIIGTGNVTVTDEANTTIQTTGANGQYGIDGSSDGAGSVSVTTSAGRHRRSPLEQASLRGMRPRRSRRTPTAPSP